MLTHLGLQSSGPSEMNSGVIAQVAWSLQTHSRHVAHPRLHLLWTLRLSLYRPDHPDQTSVSDCLCVLNNHPEEFLRVFDEECHAVVQFLQIVFQVNSCHLEQDRTCVKEKIYFLSSFNNS